MTTIRQIIETLGEEWIDAEFTVRIFDGHRNSEHSFVNNHYNQFHRFNNGPECKNLHLRLDVGLDKHRLVKCRS
jgi:hypothetical protein